MSRIAELRNEIGMSQNDLAKRLKVHQTAISQWESGRTSPRYDALEAMSKLFNASVRYLLGQSEDRTEVNHDIKGPFWSVDLEEKLKQVGCSTGFDEDNAAIWINYPDGTLEVSGDELTQLHTSSNEYMRFKLEELKKKHNQDFRPKEVTPNE